MRIKVNGAALEVAATTVAAALHELGFGTARVATALNGDFLPESLRAGQALQDGDQLEVLAPMQGG